MLHWSRLTLAILTTGLLVAGCAGKAARPTAATTRTVDASSIDTSRHAGTRSVAKNHLPDHTGIATCDDYLASYLACHRAAGIYTPGQLPMRYEAMRTSLLRDSQNPDIRPLLASRCRSLTLALRDALHGNACGPSPAPASSTH